MKKEKKKAIDPIELSDMDLETAQMIVFKVKNHTIVHDLASPTVINFVIIVNYLYINAYKKYIYKY